MEKQIEQTSKWIAESEKTVVFTGAGISTESGLPDYRGPNGVWTRRDKGLPPPRARVPMRSAKPNSAHLAVVELLRLGKLDFLISQNVDGLHIKSGIPLEKIAELHGNTNLMRCLSCDRQMTHEQAGWDKRVWGNGYRTDPIQKNQPKCPFCKERIISSIVNFGDPLPEKEFQEAVKHSQNCDVFFVIGSTLVVTPASYMPDYALKNGAKLILLNLGATPFDDRAHLRVWEKAGDFVPAVIKLVKNFQ